ncbi:MAG TPA: fused MFS/spermidine synthase [Candidatus Dormibacteraeota bacterium]
MGARPQHPPAPDAERGGRRGRFGRGRRSDQHLSARKISGLRELVASLFVVSGVASLIYQVVWTRELVLVFGNTSQAVSTTVAAFLAGLGLGGLIGGKVSQRLSRPLVGYAVAEALTGGLALLVPVAIGGLTSRYGPAYLTWNPVAAGLLRFALCFIVIGPVTALMGTTLPLLVSFSVRQVEEAGVNLSQLYTANTLGAVIGTLAAAFVLIELLGLRGTAWVAVGCNLLAAAGALYIHTRRADRYRELPPAPGRSPWPRGEAALVLVYAFFSGFVALALEVLWTRLFSEGTGGFIYVFAAILALYLLGIALGSELYYRRGTSDLRVLGACAAVVALACLVTAGIGSAGLVVMPIPGQLLLLLPATLAMGYAFPLAGRLVTDSPRLAGAQVGRMYAVNTAGAILGAFAGVFVLAPTLGTPRAIYLLGALSGAFAIVLLSRRRPARLGWSRAAVATILAMDLALGLSGTALGQTSTFNALTRGGRSARHFEDVVSTVDGVGPPQNGRLYSSGVGLTEQTVMTKLIAYYPLALRPGARNMLVIGLGMGSTYRSSLILGLRTDVVELSPSVPKEMDLYYPDAATYLHSPRGRVYISDGRNFVKVTPNRYDLVVADPPPPVNASGVVLLYSREFFDQIRADLTPGGAFVLWLPYGGLWSDFQDELMTFREAWPHEVLVGGGSLGVFMIGSAAPLSFDADALRDVFSRPTTAPDMAQSMDDPHRDAAAWMRFARSSVLATDGQFATLAGTAPAITDDRPRTEYFLLGWIFGDHRPATEGVLDGQVESRLGRRLA